MSTISTEERREVATRLRKAIGLTEFAEALGFDWTDDSDWYWKDVSNLVADLIEPGEPKVRCVAEVKVDGEQLEKLVHDATVKLTGIDRDALLGMEDEIFESATGLALISELEEDADLKDLQTTMAKVLFGYARRIREACGEVVA